MRPKPILKLVESIPLRSRPSERFLNLTRNVGLESPVRFEPTVKGENDVVI